MNNRERMRESNYKVRKWLTENNYKDIHFFPHTRYSKDVHFQGMAFDGCCSFGKRFVLFQTKTNCKPTRKEQSQMLSILEECGIIPLWFDVVKKIGVVPYGLPKEL